MTSGQTSTPHPYADELASPCIPDKCFELRKPELYKRMEDTPLTWVKTKDQLQQMVQEIQSTCSGSEIAVDVEHHDYRSYRGFVCLIQISTRMIFFEISCFDIELNKKIKE